MSPLFGVFRFLNAVWPVELHAASPHSTRLVATFDGGGHVRIVVLSQHAFRRPCPTPPKATAKTAESPSSGP